MKYFLLLFSLLFSLSAQANDLLLSFSPTMDGGYTPKLVQVGYEHDFSHPVALVAECGGMFEGENIGTCSIVPSIKVQTLSGLVARVGVGPGFVTATDSRLSSIFEFHIQGFFGLEQDGWQVGILGDHFSNAGLVLPNLGRDFVGLGVGIKVF